MEITSMINVRAIRATDEAAYLDILRRTTDDDRYYRFFRAVDHFDHADVARFVEPVPSIIGIIASDDSRGLGVAHAFISDGAAGKCSSGRLTTTWRTNPYARSMRARSMRAEPPAPIARITR